MRAPGVQQFASRRQRTTREWSYGRANLDQDVGTSQHSAVAAIAASRRLQMTVAVPGDSWLVRKEAALTQKLGRRFSGDAVPLDGPVKVRLEEVGGPAVG